jgi:undecaprenyl-diphosphatase
MESEITFWRAIVLACVQGVTEFVPVSSSGHLVLARKLLNWSDAGGLAFDTVLHAGSLAALLIYFRKDWTAICLALLGRSSGGVEIGRDEGIQRRRIAWLLAVATVPAAIGGVFLKPLMESETAVRNLLVTGLSMLATSVYFLIADRKAGEAEKRMTFLHAVCIGCAQVVALLPGASRSGWTIGAGMLCGHTRASSVRFSFLMAIPIVAGALLFQVKDIVHNATFDFMPLTMASAFAASLAVSLGAIHFCITYFQTRSLKPFAVYLACLGFLSVVVFYFKGM